MHIKSVTIDGFKSYGKRTEINGFDKAFNVITGLNGSGKSNILDAICFTLGLSNMSLARVSNLRELIFKNGQTGVTKANVAITFDNKDRNNSPSGYQDCEQIVIRREISLVGRTRYYINGFSASLTEILALLQSVRLNIQKPHFLIMQGKITRVLNMKSEEILTMVEQATGLSAYEETKKTAADSLRQKNEDLKGIDIIINEDIQPRLEQLTQEQSSLLEYQKTCIELDSLSKVHTAWQFLEYDKLCNQTHSRMAEKKQKISEKDDEIVQLVERTHEIEKQVKILEQQKDQEFGGRLSDLENQLKEGQQLEAKLSSELGIKKDNLAEAVKQKNDLLKTVKDDEKNLKAKEKEHEKLKKSFDELAQARDEHLKEMEQAQKNLEAIVAGMSKGEDGQVTASLADQLIQAKKEAADCETETKKINMKAEYFRGELAKKEKEVSSVKGTYENDLKNIQSMEQEIESLRNEMIQTGFDEDRYNKLRSDYENVSSQLDQMCDALQDMERSIPQVQFNYRPPTHPNFDEQKVFGPVCSLFQVKDPVHFPALEAVAGGRLYNIVVQDKEIAKLLLEKGQLQRRHTFLPLDAIRGQEISRDTLRNAERIVGEGNVFLASDLIKYDSKFSKVMKYVFGGALVCPDKNTANQVAFAHNVRTRTVTLDGDIFDPAGTLTGGARGQKGVTLAKVSELVGIKRNIQTMKASRSEIQQELNSSDSCRKKYQDMKKHLDMKAYELESRRNNVKNTNQHLLVEAIEKLKQDIAECDDILKNLKSTSKTSKEKVKVLENKMKNVKSTREKEQKEAETALEKAKNAYESTQNNISQREKTVRCLQLEIEELRKELDDSKISLEKVESLIENFQEEVDAANVKLEDAKKASDQLKDTVKEQKRILSAQSNEINKLIKQKDSLNRQVEECKLSIKQLKHEIHTIENEGKDASKAVNHMLKKYPWISEEKNSFGDKGSIYDFSSNDFNISEVEAKIKQLQGTKTNLAGSLNFKANNMLSDTQKESEVLTKKRQTIEEDKKGVLKTMGVADSGKKVALEKAWVEVNKNFGNIFGSLLPGSTAKLMPPEGKTISDGLEIKVSLGGVWKESLTELSGGQRSLAALSLILALSLYNPAPLYILDEVDAALDQSHTTNMGKMIKKHFGGSQFIIVSLKNDMFVDANVLFRTGFVDGFSKVERFAKSDR